ncbi:MAG: hypothetical protein ACLFM0_00485 [Spirochaetales bacterium]
MKTSRLRYNRPLIIASLLIVLFTGACATVPPAQDEARVEELVDVVNELDADRMLEQSARPFLFDSEIIELSNDVYVMWRSVYNSGFSLPNAGIESIREVDSETWRDYGDNLEMRAYFERHLPEDATIARVRAQQASFDLILGDEQNGLPKVYGLKGPL